MDKVYPYKGLVVLKGSYTEDDLRAMREAFKAGALVQCHPDSTEEQKNDMAKLNNEYIKSLNSTKNTIMVKKYDRDNQVEYYTNMTLDQIAEEPSDVNLELFGLHVINTMRAVKGLEPLKHYPVERPKYDKS